MRNVESFTGSMKTILKPLDLFAPAIMASERHQYLPLGYRHIRLLNARRDDNKQPAELRCEYLLAPLDELPVTYTAISYVWGDPTAVSQIICNGDGYLSLTASAADILNAIVEARVPGYFWIDQLCINQEDKEEKADQVRMMGEIFAFANNVIAWLGALIVDSDMATKFIVTLFNAMKELSSRNVVITTDSLCKKTGCEHPSPKWLALRNFLKRPWFERLWIVQEIIMASGEMILLCGNSSITWETLAEVVITIETNGLSRLVLHTIDEGGCNTDAPGGLLNTACVHAMKNMRNMQQPIDLQFALIYCLRFKATDPRDKLFALLGLATDTDDPVLHPNYRATVRQVFTASSRYMMTTNRSLRILHIAGIGWSRQIVDLPSWAPDWSAPQRVTIFGDMADNAGYRASASLPSNVKAGPGPDSIALKAIFVDAIHVCLPQPDVTLSRRLTDAGSKEYRNAMVSWVDQLKAAVDSSSHYAQNNFDKNDVLWRALLANTIRPGLPAREEYRHFFESWLLIHHQPAANGNDAQIDKSIWEEAWMFNAAFSDAMEARVIFTTKRGLIGIGPPYIQPGDLICIIIGAQTPFLVRRSTSAPEQAPMYEVIGDCYVHGLMNGEGLGMDKEQDIILI